MAFLEDLLLNFIGAPAYIIIFLILLACGFGVPIPEDITIVAGGLMVYYGAARMDLMILLCLAGVLIGDSVVFMLGAKFGRKLTRKWIFKKLLHEEKLDAVAKMLRKRGTKFLFAARFMPGFRTPVFFIAGTVKVPYRTFIFYDGCAALISVPVIVLAVYFLWDQFGQKLVQAIRNVEHGIFLVIFLLILALAAKWWWSRRQAGQGT